ncbi:hypothetical protein [Alicyclobacillus mengziensis]|uniref:Uncharacterized protein n=1 Tax=Alicyclobacillus mengziensis TaxID=2931921 RepID=A0A9X7VZD8_9BACL|nr:hypothetical protein [Alicyclobacillus mengziensis]QSO47893.1 hypothetical protein JZ786_02300 [Alicyclobacillus mengziensis]
MNHQGLNRERLNHERVNNLTERHTTISDLPFTVADKDLPSINAYQGQWELTGEGDIPQNYWVVTIDGNGHPMTGHGSPRQFIDRADEMGWDVAYVAPYGRRVIGKDDGIELHEWLQDHRKKHISH